MLSNGTMLPFLLLILLYFVSNQQITWVPCNLYTFGVTDTNNNTNGNNNNLRNKYSSKHPLRSASTKSTFKKAKTVYDIPMAQCSYFKRPFLNADSDPLVGQQEIGIFAKSLISSSSADKILVLLGGTISYSGETEYFTSAEFDDLMGQLSALDDSIELYSLEQRGTGRSARLNCVRSQVETIGSENGIYITVNESATMCAPDLIAAYNGTYGLEGFSLRNAASDLLYFLQQIMHDNKPIYLYGYSVFGTLLINRFMQLYGSLADSIISGIILDAPISTWGYDPYTIFYISDADFNFNRTIVDKYLADCQADGFCQEVMQYSPSGPLFTVSVTSYLESVFTRLYQNNSCPLLTNSYPIGYWKKLASLFATNPSTIPAIPAMLFRLDRCDPSDLDVLSYALEQMMNSILLHDLLHVPLTSPSLEKQILFSEAWSPQLPTYTELSNVYDACFFAPGSYVLGSIYPQWPVLPLDPYFNGTFSTNASLLVLAGGYDPISPSDEGNWQFASIGSPNKYIFNFATSLGMNLENTPVYPSANSTTPCGMQILLSFMRNPIQTPDSSCQADMIPFDWRGDPTINEQYFGVEDLFNGIYVAPIAPPVFDLYLGITIYSATCAILVVLIGCLAYYVFQLKSRINELRVQQTLEEEIEEYIEE